MRDDGSVTFDHTHHRTIQTGPQVPQPPLSCHPVAASWIQGMRVIQVEPELLDIGPKSAPRQQDENYLSRLNWLIRR